jgi:2'-5' RNA ligase
MPESELESALLIIPPPPVQSFAYPLREEYDTLSFNQVPAHITLLYPFAGAEALEQAIPRLQKICKDIAPFTVALTRYGRFDDAIFLEPADPEAILNVYRVVSQEFPEYPLYGGEHGAELHPHLTLARFDDPALAEAIEMPPEPSFEFTVEKLHIYLGSPLEDISFIPREVIPLQGTA